MDLLPADQVECIVDDASLSGQDAIGLFTPAGVKPNIAYLSRKSKSTWSP
jgi:hypothetical protein